LKSLNRFLLLSLALHILFVLGFWSQRSELPSARERAVEIQIVSSKAPVGNSPAGAVKSKSQNLKNILPEYQYGQNATREKSPEQILGLDALKTNGKAANGNDTDNEYAVYQSPIETLEQAIELDPFYNSLLAKINTALEYPEDFSENYISGSVSVQFEVDGQGRITGQRIKSESNSDLLQTYVLFQLMESLKDSLPSQVWNSQTKLPVKLQIHFVRKLPQSRTAVNCCNKIGEFLEISKFTYKEPAILGVAATKFLQKYWPPVMITPVGVTIDFVRLYTMIKEAREPDKDDLRSFRIEKLRAAMKRSILKSQD
jgi:Gram-negative bacterial TonB protein C-terminal